MKYFLIITFVLSSSFCNKAQIEDVLEISYSAQTRGFKYLIELQENTLFRDINSKKITINLNEDQVNELIEVLNKIDFEDLKSNLDKDELAVDAAIKGNLKIHFEGKIHTFEFDHNNLPDPILELLKLLEKF